MITSGLTECAICWSSCSLFLQDWKFMFTMRRGLLKALGRMVCRVLLGGFGVDVCSGCNSAAAEAQKGLYLRSYPYRRYNKLILVSF